jgi:hypothetical protein
MTAAIAIRRLDAADQDFARHLDHLLSWESVSDDAVNHRVLEIIKAVRERGVPWSSANPLSSINQRPRLCMSIVLEQSYPFCPLFSVLESASLKMAIGAGEVFTQAYERG